MPELPEVETIKLGLERKVIGLKVKRISILNTSTIQGDHKLLLFKKIIKVWRRAKILGIDLEDSLTILFHLKMTGQLIYDDGRRKLIGGHPIIDMRDEMPNKSTRVIIEFDNGSKLFFNDQRKFGWIKIVKTTEVSIIGNKYTGKLGLEPLDKDFTWSKLKLVLKRRPNTPIKVALLDQRLIVGLGNIYAAESCFNSKIDPRMKIKDFDNKRFRALYYGILKALSDGIKYGGSSLASYVNEEGQKGDYLNYAYVYNREGQECKVCKSKIEVIRQGGRSTFYCPKCQK